MTERFFGLSGVAVSSFCGDKAEFLGRGNGYEAPQGVTSGDLGGEQCYNENACGALSCVIVLQPGETKELCFIAGEKYNKEAEEILKAYEEPGKAVSDDLENLKSFWEERLSHFQVKTPCKEFDTMINTWNAYNCFMTFIWSRAASLTYCGLRNGYGYRDTVQDIQGVIHLAPELAAEKIRFMLSAQVEHGGGLPLVKFTHDPGHEDTPEEESYVRATGHPAYRADDALWLFPTVYKYMTETGNIGFLDEVIPFANKGEGTVYEHLKRAIDFSKNHLGPHGMPAGLYADWNDCLRLGANGESSFVAFQYFYAMTIMRIFAIEKKDTAYAPSMQNDRAEIRQLEPYCYGQFTEGKASKHFGRSHVHWLTGTASTVMVGCVEGILGMRPTLDGLRIIPSVPSEWEQFEIEKDFRGKHLHIIVKNPGHAESGCKKLVLNGCDIQDDYIDAKLLSPYNEVELWMS